MKRLFFVALVLILLFSLFGCAATEYYGETVKSVSVDGTSFTVDTEKSTISDGKYTYTYEYSTSGTVINYPNGDKYTWDEVNGTGTGTSSSLEADFTEYTNPMTLCDVVSQAVSANGKTTNGNFVGGLLLVLIGAFDGIWPKKAWKIGKGWYYKDVEPTEVALRLYRIGGIIAALIGLIVMFR